jgi:hypothetical protein
MPLAYTEVTTTGWVIYGFVGVVTVATVGFALYLQIVSSEWLGRVVNLDAGGGVAAWQHRRGPRRGRQSFLRAERTGLTRQNSGIQRPKYQKPKPPKMGLNTGTTV